MVIPIVECGWGAEEMKVIRGNKGGGYSSGSSCGSGGGDDGGNY